MTLSVELKQLKSQLESVVEELHDFTQHIASLPPTNTLQQIQAIELQIRIGEVEPLVSKYNDLSSKLKIHEHTIPDEDKTKFRSAYFKQLAKAKEIILTFETANVRQPETSVIQPSNPVIVTNAPKSSLPALKLTTFDGEYHNWLQFKDCFTTMVHNDKHIADYEKLQHLQSCLTNKAKAVIENIQCTNDNYKVAWDLLVSRFENTALLVHSHIQSIINIPNMTKESHVALRHIHDTLNKNVRAIKNLNVVPIDSWDTMLIHLIHEKLDSNTKKAYGKHTFTSKFPSLEEFNQFLRLQCDLLETTEGNKSNTSNQRNDNTKTRESIQRTQTHVVTNTNTNYPFSCLCCNGAHSIYKCKTFIDMSPRARFELVNSKKLCKNCLRDNHTTSECNSPIRCKNCNKFHHSLLHLDNHPTSQSTQPSNNNIQQDQAHQTNTHFSTNTNSEVLLSTAVIEVRNFAGIRVTARCLLDPGSQSNIISEDLCNKLKLQTSPVNVKISGINMTTSTVQAATKVSIHSLHDKYETVLSCLVTKHVTGHLPSISFDQSILDIPTELPLADPDFNKSEPIDIIIGATHFYALLCTGQLRLSNSNAILQKTRLGWIISGEILLPRAIKSSIHQTTNNTIITCLTTVNPDDILNQQLRQFWELEETPTTRPAYSLEEESCEQHYYSNVKRNSDGRFIVALPFKKTPDCLGNSRDTALARFHNLERKLIKDHTMREEYTRFMREYEDLGHMTRLPSELEQQHESNKTYYMPHHAVTKSDSLTTKTRVVFDASAKSDNGTSINDILMTGPTLQRDLLSILIRFRQYSVVLTADIAKMYRQVLISADNRPFHRIFWRETPTQQLQCFELNTVTYGTSSAPYLAVKCLIHLSDLFSKQHPETCQVIKDCFYVDDLLTGGESPSEVIQLQRELSTILSSAGFELRKYLSNCDTVMSYINRNVSDTEFKILQLHEDETTKTLGITWNSTTDTIQYSVFLSNSFGNTKRAILSLISKIYDPLGLLSPVVIWAKMMIQELWKLKLSWDEPIPQPIELQWKHLVEQLPDANNLKIRRHIKLKHSQSIELHGFSDASTKAYGACVFLRSIGPNGEVGVELICAKSRVAPLNTITLPRLELCGATLLTKLLAKVQASLTLKIDKIYYWTDSTIVLHWINATPNRWKVFVSHRVAEIQKYSEPSDWYHIESKDNPADLLSRGTTVKELSKADLWWHGPKFLKTTTLSIAPFVVDITTEANLPETKTIKIQNFSSQRAIVDDITHLYSSFYKLQKVVAYILRFKSNCLKPKVNRHTGPLTIPELATSLKVLVKISQAKYFKPEIQQLQRNQPLHHQGKLHSLSPFLDSDNILRVGGRLQHSTYSFDKKHPMLLHHQDNLTRLIMSYYHMLTAHGASQSLLSIVRTKFWPLHGKDLAKKIIHRCLTCYRNHPKFLTPLMGSLPAGRINISSPFAEVGVDYAGPFLLKDRKTRNPKITKAYVALFVCFATRAIHLELVSDLTTDAFLACLRRFISRRGKPETMNSDNGSNFIGASAEIKNLYRFIRENSTFILESLAKDEITWQFIPPRSPHFGGIWEAGVKSTKHHLKR